MTRAAAAAAAVCIGALTLWPGSGGAPVHAQNAAGDEWRNFEGSWSAIVRRQTLPTGGARPASLVQLSGSVTLSAQDGLSAGFHGEAIGFDDGGSAIAGRGLWTDSRGDRIFSAFRADLLQGGQRFVGTITGGTGRYEGVTGEYSLTWQYVVSGDDNVSQGRTVDLKGRFRRASP